jgi:excinuclease ABC subunit A
MAPAPNAKDWRIYQVNMAEVVPDESKSIKDGAIAPLGGERDAWTFQQRAARKAQ